MKVLGIVCSPRKGGNTEILMKEALSSAGDSGAETELLTLYDKNMKPCDGCYSCLKTGKCHIKDDIQDIYPKLIEADGIIWGSPVYFFSVTSQAKMLIDRLYPLHNSGKLANKVGGVISVASSIGHTEVWNLFNAFFSSNHMISADLVYGYARDKGDIRKDKHAMKASMEQGKQVVLLIKRKFKYPKEYDIPIYRLVRRKYGIDMSPAMGRFETK